ncbi:CAP domain-containing protein [Streptomyces anandii]|uniref:CAP domain-containing protein n=1 Tax=Streptomyces anandii TaxID=285454 RepID=UPI0037A91139
MGKHRKNQHYRRMVVAAFSVSAVAIPSVALACTDWQDSGGHRAESAAAGATATRWKDADADIRQQHTWLNGHRHHSRHHSLHHDGTGHANPKASATPTAPTATATASKPATAAAGAPKAHTHRPSAPRKSTAATTPVTHAPATPGTTASEPSAPAAVAPAPTVTASAPASTPPATAPTASGVVARIVQLVNAERAKVGCSPLTLNADLSKAAQAHSDDMAAHQNMSHTGSDGSSPGDRITSAGYTWSSYGENVAYGYSTAEQVMAAWMASPGHKANILNCGFREIGVGLAEPGDYWTQDFGAAR